MYYHIDNVFPKERWQLQQEAGRLRAQQAAFEEERTASLKRLEEDREQLQQAKVRVRIKNLHL